MAALPVLQDYCNNIVRWYMWKHFEKYEGINSDSQLILVIFNEKNLFYK